MDLETKAFYSLVRLSHQSDPTLACEPWQIEDLRKLPKEELFRRLVDAGLPLDERVFWGFSKECDSPEDLAELLLHDLVNPSHYDPLYLVLFELWRRLLPERQSLSIFCDELDHRSDELIQDALANLKDILEENVDAGAKEKEVFGLLSNYSAHDVMSFVIDYISDLLDEGSQIYASELIEDFAPFASQPIWFDFLRIRLLALVDPVASNHQTLKLLERQKELSVDLLLEILAQQMSFGEKPVFCCIVQCILSLMKQPEEFQELLELSAEYFRRRDRDDLEEAVQRILSQRLDSSAALQKSQVEEFAHIIEPLRHKL
jgi:hypothetical protein